MCSFTAAIGCNVSDNKKAQLTQRGTRDSGAHLKAYCEQNLSSVIQAVAFDTMIMKAVAFTLAR